MAYFKINDVDFSHCVNKLEIKEKANYNAQTNAAGDTVVDYINHKRQVTVGIIPLTDEDMQHLLFATINFEMTISYRDPHNGHLDTINCILPENAVSYYTIQTGKTLFNAFTLTFTEL